jgi:hypothetical protein
VQVPRPKAAKPKAPKTAKPVRKKAAPKKPAARKPVAAPKKPVSPPKPAPEPVAGILLGKVADYFGHVSAIAVTLQADLAVGDTIRVKGHTTDFTEPVATLEIEHQTVTAAKAGDGVGIGVKERCRKGDKVYKI